jgi:hypothetical protein
MKFGLNVPNYGSGGTPDALNAWAVLAEDEGYDLVMISDHIAVTDQVHELYPAPFCDPFIALAYLAGVTQRLELGTTVLVVPYRHPLLAARMAGRFLARRVACRWPASPSWAPPSHGRDPANLRRRTPRRDSGRGSPSRVRATMAKLTPFPLFEGSCAEAMEFCALASVGTSPSRASATRRWGSRRRPSCGKKSPTPI